MDTVFTESQQRHVITLLAIVQFLNIVDFMMVMPLGPDFALALHIPTEHVGVIGGAYAFAAALTGLLLVPVLDRLDRRVALSCTALGLGFATVVATQAQGLYSLVGARVLAGIFGGAAASLSLATVADVIPPERRGRAMAGVMAAFSLAAVAGVPIGLELALRLGWQAPFAVIGVLALSVAALLWRALPRGLHHPHHQGGWARFAVLLANPAVLLGYCLVASAMFAGFLIIPNIATFLVFNVGFPREQISLLYMLGGAASFVVIQTAGRALDRYGALPVSLLGTAVLALILVLGFLPEHPLLPAYVVFLFFMMGMNIRYVTNQTVVSKIAEPRLRAGYMSLQTAVQHVATTLGALVSSRILVSGGDGRLLHMSWVVALAVAASLLQPVLVVALRGSPHTHEAIH